MLRLSGVKFSISATSSQTGMFAVSRIVCCAIVVRNSLVTSSGWRKVNGTSPTVIWSMSQRRTGW